MKNILEVHRGPIENHSPVKTSRAVMNLGIRAGFTWMVGCLFVAVFYPMSIGESLQERIGQSWSTWHYWIIVAGIVLWIVILFSFFVTSKPDFIDKGKMASFLNDVLIGVASISLAVILEASIPKISKSHEFFPIVVSVISILCLLFWPIIREFKRGI